MKAAGKADFLKGKIRFIQHSVRCLQAVPDQRVNGGTAHIGRETASGFAAADMRRVCNLFERDGLRIMLVNESNHLLEAYLASDLYARGFRFREPVQSAENILKQAADVPLHRHFITGRLFLQTAVGIPDQTVDFIKRRVFVPKDDKGQGIALHDGMNVFLINDAVRGSDGSTGKQDVGYGVGLFAGYLSDAVQHISVDKNAVAGVQRDMLLPDLKIQHAACRRCDFKVRVPVERPRPMGQLSQLIMIIEDWE